MRQLRLLNGNGDIVISWTAEHDDAIEKIIEKKMAEGMVFFVLQPQAGGLLPPARLELEHPKDARRYRALAIDDPDFSDFVVSGKGQVVSAPPAEVPLKTVRRGRKPREIVESDSVGLKQKKGG